MLFEKHEVLLCAQYILILKFSYINNKLLASGKFPHLFLTPIYQ